MGMKISKFGDWTKAGVVLQALNVRLIPFCKFRLEEDGNLVLTTMVDHINNQDLPWTPLSEHTIELKGGDDTIYVESGFLRDNLKVRKVKSSADNLTFFIGADAWTTTPDGEKFSDLMIWLEYGTDKMPPRPLIRPSVEEVKSVILRNWRDIIADFIGRVG